MNKLISAIILAIVAHSVAADYIPEGGLCESIIGPVGTCVEGTTCCILGPDNGVCMTQCPVPIGGTCGTIAGTKPCVGGAPCCYISPDNGICKLHCKKQM